MSESDILKITKAVRSLRGYLCENQQAFADRLGLHVRTIPNYEKDRVPTDRVIAALAVLAAQNNQPLLRDIFMQTLAKQLRLGAEIVIRVRAKSK